MITLVCVTIYLKTSRRNISKSNKHILGVFNVQFYATPTNFRFYKRHYYISLIE